MRNQLIKAIKDRWDHKMTPFITVGQFMKYVYAVFVMLELHNIQSGDTIALYGKRSIRWIGIYIVALLKKVNLVIIPVDMSFDIKTVHHYLNISEANILFADKDVGGRIKIDMKIIPFVHVIYDIESILPLQTRITSENTVTACYPLGEIDDIIIEKEDIDEIFFDDCPHLPHSIIIPTSGVSHQEPKFVVIDSIQIEAQLSKVLEEIPYDLNDTVYSKTDFASSHLISVLMPFLKGCIFVGHVEDANVFIEDTQTFEKVWRKEVDSILESWLLNFIFNRKWMQKLFDKLALKRLKWYYNRGKKVDHIILYNNTVHERAMRVIRDNLPLWSTYGSQETCQLVAYNDYSTEKLRKPNCAGKILRGVDYKVKDGHLYLNASTVFSKYLADPGYTNYVKNELWYKTGDYAGLDEEENLFVYGRIMNVHKTDTGIPIHLDNLARILRGDPYIKDVVLVSYNGELVLHYYPDDSFAEARNMDIFQLEDRMKNVFLEKVNDHLDSISQITDIQFRPNDFIRTYDGKVKKSYYQLV